MKQFPVAVIMEKRRLENRWVSEKWEAIGVVPALDAPVDAPTRRIFADDEREQFLVGHFPLELFRDEVDNYHLNLTSPEPRVFVMWRMDEDFARPMEVTLSYGEAARSPSKSTPSTSAAKLCRRPLSANIRSPSTSTSAKSSR